MLTYCKRNKPLPDSIYHEKSVSRGMNLNDMAKTSVLPGLVKRASDHIVDFGFYRYF